MTLESPNNIGTQQSEQYAVNLASTFRREYKKAKFWKSCLWATSFCLAILQIYLSTEPYWLEGLLPTDTTPYLVIATILVMTLSVFGKHWKINPAIRTANFAQQAHDHHCLELGNKPSFRLLPPSLVDSHGQKYKKSNASDHNELSNWWPQSISTLPLAQAQCICLLMTYRWDTQLRKNYQKTLWAIALICIAGTLYAAQAAEYTIADTITLLILPGIPFWGLLLDEILSNKEFYQQADLTLHDTEALWNNFDQISNIKQQLWDTHYEWQQYRKSAPLIFDWLYWISRKKMEGDMRYDSSALIAQKPN